MPIISPKDIAAKVAKAYPRFLQKWVCHEDANFFPMRVRANLKADPKQPTAAIAATEELLAAAKDARGWGYTVHRERVRSRDLGTNDFPKSITIDSLDDLLRLSRKADDFAAVRSVTSQVRAELPGLESWLRGHVQTLSALADCCEDLILVTKFFLEHPWPDCYARQIPVRVDTKFVHRHGKTLRQWLDELLPASAIDVNETKFARRFGLRDGEPHRGIRLLDPQLTDEIGLPYGELSLPLRSIAELPVTSATAFIVENDLNLVTMPEFERGIGVRGEGNSVNRLERVRWLASNRVYYWGDIDVEGFLILSRLRNLFPCVRSLMMDLATIESQSEFHVDGNHTEATPPTNLTSCEAAAFDHCVRNNYRLEQEKILQSHVDAVFDKLRE